MYSQRYCHIHSRKRKNSAKSCLFWCFAVLGIVVLVYLSVYYGRKRYYSKDGFRSFSGQVDIDQFEGSWWNDDKQYYESDKPIPGFYYLKKYVATIDTDKKYLKQILAFFNDTLPQLLPFKNVNSEYSACLYKHQSTIERDRGSFTYFVDSEDCYNVGYIEQDPCYFRYFNTWSKSDYSDNLSDYNCECSDSTISVTFAYTGFDVDVWQKFLDIVVLKSNDLSYNHFLLINPLTNNPDCEIRTKVFNNDIGFKMEIL